MDIRIRMDEHALCGKPLGAVTGDGVPVVEMAVFGSVEFDVVVIVQTCSDSAIRMDRFNNAEVTIGDA